MDLYRLPRETSLEFLNIPEIFDSSLCLIEWPDRLGQLPNQYIDIDITIERNQERILNIKCIGDKWASRKIMF